ncbi:MAG: LysR substrate-binding domain-containing protein [Thermodesulfobacteriota bacterium]
MAITLRQLEIFIAVAETQQVTRASEKLHLTQSAVSMALNELQKQLGGPLFDRRGRRLLINDRGRYLLPFGKEILSQVNNVEALMSEKGESVAGSLKIVASSTIGNYVLPYLIGVFKNLHPAASLNMMVCNTRHAEKLILEGEADLGFVEGEVGHEEVMLLPWLQDELVVIASPAQEVAGQETFRVPEDLGRCAWIMREKGSGTAQVFKKKLGRHVTGLKVAMELGHSEAIKKAVEADAGVACLSSLTVCREVEEGWLARLRVEGVDMQRTLHIIYYKHKVMTGLMREFIDFCIMLRECSQGCACLTSPWKLQDLLTRADRMPAGRNR